GSEIKSLRNKPINFRARNVELRAGEFCLLGVLIRPYVQSSIYGLSDPSRSRKLLLHMRETAQLTPRMRERGVTCIPTGVYLQSGLPQVDIVRAKGKKLYDKRAASAKRDAEREIRQALKNRYDSRALTFG